MAPARIIACALGAALLASPAALGQTPRPVFAPPQRYYLALGDSLAYGIQPARFEAGLPPSGFDTGYVDVFARALRTLAPGLRVVNYGCPGETTVTFARGGCPWLAGGRPLHDEFRGAQLRAALAFLRAHPGEVSPITINLGGGDADAFSKACKGSFACARARARGLTLGRTAAGARAYFADPFPLFNPQGNLAREKARICAYTFTCSRGDGHPTDAGYRAIAAAVLRASGYKHRS